MVRVQAESEKQARRLLAQLDAIDLGSAPRLNLRITEVSMDDTQPDLFEVDGLDIYDHRAVSP